MTENPRQETAPARRHTPLRAAAALALALGSCLAPAPAAADPADPPALAQVHPFKGAADPCAATGGDVVGQAPWTHHFLGLSKAHELSTGQGVRVAVLATGTDADAPGLGGAVEGGGSGDCLGFGTFLAGVVAARPVPGSGLVGVAPEASVVAVPTGDAGTGTTTAGQVAAGIGSAVDAGARVVLVGTAAWEGSSELDAAVAAAAGAGALVVAPATVDTARGAMPGYPAQDPSVLSVAAHDVEGAPTAESLLLLPSGELARVDLTAPGERVPGLGPGGGHVAAGGDGVAAAFVAGSAALLMAREPGLSAERVRERLLDTAYASPFGPADPYTGGGRVDPLGAMATTGSGPAATVRGEGFVPGPSPRGSLSEIPTAAVVAVSVLLIVLCGLGGAVVRNGRARGWRPAAPGEAPLGGPAADATVPGRGVPPVRAAR
ncbi:MULTISPECIES: S8 family serine peptidase [unclassified Nocardiopsis]|uniref:S8 family serine peptidase n=1 Tax=unclassified Nocardiopsis TaxID=2649073 RepID=UPI001F181FA9|nr:MULTISPECIES: S8 family serine peptidase [unclassified Nocardiopsis]